jgi:hypothetical protein
LPGRLRRRFALSVYGYLVMPEHFHVLLSEPEHGMLADAIHYLKLSFTKRLHGLCKHGSQVNAEKRGANLGHAPGAPR